MWIEYVDYDDDDYDDDDHEQIQDSQSGRSMPDDDCISCCLPNKILQLRGESIIEGKENA